MKMRFLFILLTGFMPVVNAAEIVVPRDYPNTQAAIDAASAGDVILVRTSGHQEGPSGALVVDKPLTIIGDPVCNVWVVGTGGPPQGVVFDGPGFGDLVLSGFRIAHEVKDDVYAKSFSGGGFRSVTLIDCMNSVWVLPTGGTNEPYPGVLLTTVDELVVVNSSISGGAGDGYGGYCLYPEGSWDGAPGVLAPDTRVTIIDSVITGGDGSQWGSYTASHCREKSPSWRGRGGAGVVGKEVSTWGSTISGGIGTRWIYDPKVCSANGLELDCGKVPDGPAVISTQVQRSCSRLTQATPTVAVGGSWDLTWSTNDGVCLPIHGTSSGPAAAFLFASFRPIASPFEYPLGAVYLDPSLVYSLAVFNAEVGLGLSFTVPSIPELVGLPLSAQVILGNGTLSGPVFGLIVP